MSATPIYIHAVGAVTPLGGTWQATVPGLLAGRSAIAPITTFDVRGFPCTAGAVVPDSELPPLPQTLPPDRRLRLFLPALAEALAALPAPLPLGPRLGVFLGAESGRASLSAVCQLVQLAGGGTDFDHRQFGVNAAHFARQQPQQALLVSSAAVAQHVAVLHHATGPVQTFSLACASSAAAIIEAVRALRLGLCGVAVTGGVGADVDPLMLAGFGKLSALSLRGESCPFDVRRDGFVLGEGAAALILSRTPPPRFPQQPCVAILGVGRSLDAYHLTAPDPEGHGAERAMRQALSDAGLSHVDYVQAHGTSTPLNDVVEASVLGRVFCDTRQTLALRPLPWVSSFKGALGHPIAAAGAIGVLCAHEALRTQILPPTAGLSQPDPRCDLPHITGHSMQAPIRTALVNAFAFGGANCSLVLSRC